MRRLRRATKLFTAKQISQIGFISAMGIEDARVVGDLIREGQSIDELLARAKKESQRRQWAKLQRKLVNFDESETKEQTQ